MRQHDDDDGTELTGNHYLFLPDIRRADGAAGTLSLLHRRLGGVLAFHGGEAPLLRPRFLENGTPLALGTLRWERLDRWLPRFRGTVPGGLTLTGTWCAPGAWGGEIRGAVLVVEVENTGPAERTVEVELAVRSAGLRLGAASARELPLPRTFVAHPEAGALVLEAGVGSGGGAALAVAGPPRSRVGRGDERWEHMREEVASPGQPLEGWARAAVRVRGRGRATATFHLALAPERDGALAGAARLRRLGGPELLRHARLDLTSLLRTPKAGEWAGTLNRNLLLAYYGTLGRALDDDRVYLVAGRDPAPGPSGVFTELEQLLWTLPALALLDAPLAREALVTALEIHAPRAGQGTRYLDGGLLGPALSLGGAALWPLAVERYARDTADTALLEEPLVQELVRDLDVLLTTRFHSEVFLAGTEVLLSGEEADHPFAVVDNAILAAAADALDRLRRPEREAPPAPLRNAGEEVRAALWQRGTVDVDGETVLPSSVDLEGSAAVYDDPDASLGLLPELGFCSPEDPLWSGTMAFLRGPGYALWQGTARVPGLARRDRPGEGRLAALCTDLLGPRREEALRTLAALHGPDGFARDAYDPATGALLGAPRPALAGLLGWTLARALGEKPPGAPPGA